MDQKKVNFTVAMLFILLLIVVFIDRIVHFNGPAKAAVIYRPFNDGLMMSHVYREGMFLTWPWNKVYRFNTREQFIDKRLDIVVKNGVTVNVRINYRFAPIQDSLPIIFRKYGLRYDSVFVEPEIVYAIREVISSLNPEEIYTLKIDSITTSSFSLAKNRLKEGNIRVTDIYLLDIKLPPKVVNAIESKLQEEQLNQQYAFKQEVAKKDRDIKIIEAAAIKKACDTISSGLTPEYLQFKQIEAFLKLSESPNSKTIIMPQNAKTPFILNAN